MLATLADLRAYLGLPASGSGTTAEDAILTRLLTAVSDWFENQTGRKLASATYTSEPHDGNGRDFIVPKHYPVTAVSAVVVGSFTVPSAANNTASGWFVDESVVRLRGYHATFGQGNVVITYTAGFATIPADIVQAVLEMAALKWRERPHLGQQSQTMAGMAVSFLPSIVPQSVQSVVDAYRRPVV